MPDVPQVISMRERQRQKERRNVGGALGLGFALLLSLVVALSGVVLGLAYTDLSRDLPSLEALPALLNPPQGELLQPTRIYDRSGQHVLLTLENPGAVEREYPNLDTTQSNFLPPALITATLTSADPDFWQHSGFASAGLHQGLHPTLAQQLVSDLLLWDEPPGLRRSLRERLLAAQITARYGRPQVLTWYLNSVNYGRLAQGADAAARVYFDKPVSQLTLGEATLFSPGAASERLRSQLAEALSVGGDWSGTLAALVHRLWPGLPVLFVDGAHPAVLAAQGEWLAASTTWPHTKHAARISGARSAAWRFASLTAPSTWTA